MPAIPASKKAAPALVAGAVPPFIRRAVAYFIFSYSYFFLRSSPCVELGNPINAKL